MACMQKGRKILSGIFTYILRIVFFKASVACFRLLRGYESVYSSICAFMLASPRVHATVLASLDTVEKKTVAFCRDSE